MKRGKDDDKIMGPMFPRLHVNDTEKGGPRAPPRNKMALYEQLTVPSQRYNIGAVPPSQNSNLVSSTSTNQVTGRERNMYFPLYRQHSASSYDELQVRQPEAVNLGSETTQVENRTKPVEEDDFMVPIFSQPGIGQCNGKTQNSMDGERASHLSLNHTMPLQDNGEKLTSSISNGDPASRQNVINQDCRNLRASNVPTRSSDLSTREKDGGSPNENAFVQRGCREKRVNRLEKTDACLSQDDEDSLQPVKPRYGEISSEHPLQSNKKDISLKLKHNPRAGCEYKDLDELDNGMARIEDEHSLERENIDRGNDVSETSMVDSISGGDICPDDVVGIIGRKHFWKARTAIVNQQRVFAVQVFELHRLIKVQKHIAGSPHLLLEGSAFVGKTSLKDSALKKYSSEYGVEALAHSVKKKDDSQKPADKLEGTAENAVAKAPAHLHKAIQPAGYRPPSVSPALSPPVNMDPKMNPWGFQQPAMHQWLVPVMSPSEGLVYKPYPAPGMMGPMCGGGYGPEGPSPTVGNIMNPTYGMPNPHYHQGMGMPQPIPYGGQGYFPGYAMPLMSPVMSGSAVDKMNQFSGPNLYGQTSQPATASVNQSLQNQNSCNMSGQKNGTAAMALPSRDVDRQGSTASSPSERTQGTAMPVQTEGRDALPLFPTAPTTEISEGALPTEKASRVIKVVPHNPRSTRESAARIFQSIQAERQQYETN